MRLIKALPPPFRLAHLVLILVVWAGITKDAKASVSDGRSALRLKTNQGLQTAHDRFAAALQANPANDEAKFLKAATGLVLETTRAGFRQELTRFGVTIVNPNIYNFVYEYPADQNGVLQPAKDVMSDAALSYVLSRRATLDAALGSLEDIKENFRTSLSYEETSLAAVQVDFADICLMRALLHCGKAFVALAQSYNVSAEYALFHRLFAADQLNPQQVLAALPNMLRFTNEKSKRESARSSLLLAHAEFKKAYQFISTKRQPSGATPYFFEFTDLNEADRLAAELQSLADSIRDTAMLPAQPGENDQLARQRVSLSRLFAANAPAPRDLLPRYFDRGFFRRGAASWLDRTLGGILPDATPDLLDSFTLGFGLLQNTLYYPYSFSLLVGAPEPPLEGAPPTAEPIFGEISGIAADPEGNLYVADRGDHVIRKVARDGTVTVVAGQKWRTWEEREQLVRRSYAGGAGEGGYIRTWNDAPSDIFVDGPKGIACDRNGTVYFSDGYRIMRLGRDGRLTAIAGRPSSSSSFLRGRDGVGAQAVFISPGHLACDAAGNIYVCDVGSVRKITPGGVVTTVAGIPSWDEEAYGYLDGPREQVRFGDLRGIAVDASGNIYVNDSNYGAVRKITPDGTTSTLAGGPKAPYVHFDGKAAGAELIAGLRDSRGLAIDAAGRLFFGDGSTIRCVFPEGKVTTIGGHPAKGGFVMEVGDRARFPYSSSRRMRFFTVDARGTLYAGNSSGDIIRGVSAVVPPSNVSFPAPQPYPQPGPDDPKGPPWPAVPAPSGSSTVEFGAFAFSTNKVVLSGQDASVELSGTYQGDLDYLEVSMSFRGNSDASPSRSLTFSFLAPFYLNSTEPRDRERVVSMPGSISSGLPSGEWVVERVLWRQKNEISTWVGPGSDGWDESPFADLSFSVENQTPDTKPPQITKLEMLPNKARADAAQEQRLSLLVTVADEGSGLSNGSVGFRNMNTGDTLSLSASFNDWNFFAADPGDGNVAGTGPTKTYRADVILPKEIPSADWGINGLFAADQAGNSVHYVFSYSPSAWHVTQTTYEPLPDKLQGALFTTGPDLPLQPNSRDRQPPTLVDLEFVPATVDVTQSDTEVELRLRLADNLSGFQSGNIELASINQSDRVQVDFSIGQLVQGNALDGVVSVGVPLPRGASPGAWRATYISLSDQEYNYRYYSDYDQGFSETAAAKSLTVVSDGRRIAPLLRGLEVVLPDGQKELNTLTADQTVSVRVMVTQPGPLYPPYWRSVGTVGLRSPSGTQYLWSDFGSGHLVAGDAKVGTYEIVFRLPQFSEEGMWQVDYVEFEDTFSWGRFHYGATEFVAADLPKLKREFLVRGLPRWWEQTKFTLAPEPQPIAIQLSPTLNLSFNGAERFVAATVPGGPPDINLSSRIVFTYDGLTTAPVLPGTYEVVAFVDHLNYTGRATGRLTITGIASDLRITQDPVPATVYAGETARFSVTAAGEGRLTYLWYYNGQQIPQSNRPQLAVTAASVSNAGRYKVVVTDSKGNSAESAEAQLTVLPVANWVWDGGEEPRLADLGQRLILSGRAIDIPTGSFVNLQWLRDGKRIPNARGSEFVIDAADASHAGTYTVQVTTNKGTMTSAPVRLTINDGTILVYRLSAREQSWDITGRQSGKLTGYLVLDRQAEEPKGAFIWRGNSPSVNRTELRPDLVASSTGPGRGTRTVVSSTTTTGEYPAQEHETVWLAGDDSVFQLPGRTWIAAPRSMSGWILSKTEGDAGVGFTVNSLTMNFDRDATEAHAGKAFEEVVEAVQGAAP